MPARAIIASALALAAAPVHASDLDGVWLRGDGNAKVRIASCGADLCATNVWIGDTSGGEAAGDRLVMKVARQPDGRWTGTAFDPKRDLTVSMTVTLEPGGFSTRGCVLGGLLCKSVTWTAAR